MIIHNRALGRSIDPVMPTSNSVEQLHDIAIQVAIEDKEALEILRQEEIKVKRVENLKRAREARAAKREAN